MNDGTVRMSCVIATSIWVLAVLTTLVGTISLIANHLNVALALYAHSVLFIAAAVVSTVRVYMERNVRLVLDALKMTNGLRQIP